MSSSRSTDQAGPATLRASIDALRSGELAGWLPVPVGATGDWLADLEHTATGNHLLLGQPATAWRLPATPALPTGLTVWLQHGLVTLVETTHPVVRSLDPLGTPELILASGLSPSQDQLCWPSRGLLLHVTRLSGEVARLFGHEQTTVAAIESSPLAQIRVERRPHR